MRRTTLLLEEDLYQRVRRMASRRGTTASQVIREAILGFLDSREERRDLPSFTAVGASGRTDIAEDHERMLAEAADRSEGW